MLPSGGKLYLWADVAAARPILDVIEFQDLSLHAAGTVLDRTGSAAAVFFNRAVGEGFFMALRGNYPTFQAGFSMAFSRAWRRQRSVTGNPYWYSQFYEIAMAMGSSLALVSTSDPFISVPAENTHVQPPGGFNEFRNGSVIAGWINDPTETISQFMNTFAIPIQIPAEDFFFCVIPNGDDLWELAFHVRTPSAIQARAILSLFTLARGFIISNPAGQNEKSSIADFIPLLFARLPRREDDVLTLRSAVLSTQELSLLFEAFSVYSYQNDPHQQIFF